MARRVPTLGVNPHLPQPQQPVPVSSRDAFSAFSDGLRDAFEYIRPIAAEESAARGAAQASDAVASGDQISPRSPFTVSSRAFNATAARGVAVRAATDAQQAISEAVRLKGHDPEQLASSLEALRSGYKSELGDWPQVQVEFDAIWQRQAAAANRAAGNLAVQAIIDQDKAAAAAAIETYERGVAQLALSGGTADEIAAEMAQMQDLLIQFGPRGEFELNGQTYAQDDSRAGSMTVTDIQRAVLGSRDRVEVLAIQGEFARSNAKGAFARRFKAELLAGNAPVDPAKGLALLGRMEAEVRSLNAAGRAARSAARTEMRAIVTMINQGTAAGFPPAIKWSELETRAAGDPQLLREIRDSQTRAQAIEQTRGLGPADRAAYIDATTDRVAAVAEAGGVDAAGIRVIKQLTAINERYLAAITAEGIELDTAEDALSAAGAILSPEGVADLRAQAEGKPELLERIDELEASTAFVREFRGMTEAQRERGIELMKSQIAQLTEAGTAPGNLLAGLDAVERDGNMLAGLAATDPMQVATLQELPVPELDLEDSGTIAESLAGRVPAAEEIERRYGVEPRLIRPGELMAVQTALDGMSADQKMGLITGLGQLPERVAATLADDLSGISGGFGHVAAVNQAGNTAAASAMLRGQELLAAKIGKPPSSIVRLDARLEVGLDGLELDAEATALIEQSAIAYAVGIANGGEVTQDLLAEGYQRAMFRQEDGSGGLVRSQFGNVLLPAGVDESRFEDLVLSTTDADLRAMNGGELPTDGLGNEITATDLADTTLQTVVPGFYILTLPGGGGVTGLGPGGNFLYGLQGVATTRAAERDAALAVELDQLDASGKVRRQIGALRMRVITGEVHMGTPEFREIEAQILDLHNSLAD